MLEEGMDGCLPPGRQKWIDYQTGKVRPGWNHIECGTLPIIILVKDGRPSPYPRGTMHRPDEMGQDYVEEVSGTKRKLKGWEGLQRMSIP